MAETYSRTSPDRLLVEREFTGWMSSRVFIITFMNPFQRLRALLGLRSFTYVGTAEEFEADALDRALVDCGPDRYSSLNVDAPESEGPYTCPCCGHRTLPSRGNYDLCSACNWEDDGQDDHDFEVVRVGPNGISLERARQEYLSSGGRRQTHVPPSPPR